MRRPLTHALVAVLYCSATLFIAADAEEPRLEHLASWLAGSFSSAEQAAEDEEFFDIRLEMARIWTDRSDGPWLYIEQATASRLDQPYRQRVYRLVAQEDGAIGSVVYEMPEPLRFAGAAAKDDPLAEISPEDLTEREGCTVVLRWHEDEQAYRGSTVEDHCKSSLRGASYATSSVDVHADRLVSWDQGFSADGAQVWGAVKGGYVFKRN